MSWFFSLIIGGVVGWLASIIMKTNPQMGLLANVLVGVVGSLLGFWIAGLLCEHWHNRSAEIGGLDGKEVKFSILKRYSLYFPMQKCSVN